MISSAEAVGYRGLWSAVIVQAFADLRLHTFKSDIPHIKKTGNLFNDRRRMKIALLNREGVKRDWQAARQNALNWIFSDSTHPTSFLWICDCLDYDAELLRNMASSCAGIEQVLKGKKK
jgi:hypothetical protein